MIYPCSYRPPVGVKATLSAASTLTHLSVGVIYQLGNRVNVSVTGMCDRPPMLDGTGIYSCSIPVSSNFFAAFLLVKGRRLTAQLSGPVILPGASSQASRFVVAAFGTRRFKPLC